MQHLKFVVRWTDQDNKNHSKEYGDDAAARKAKAWLIDRGAISVDIAVSIGSKQISGGNAIPEGAHPGIEQQSFIK